MEDDDGPLISGVGLVSCGGAWLFAELLNAFALLLSNRSGVCEVGGIGLSATGGVGLLLWFGDNWFGTALKDDGGCRYGRSPVFEEK